MRFLKLLAVLAAVASGTAAVSGQASATPLGSGTFATVPAQAAAGTLVEKAQSYRRRGFYGYRPFYRRPYWRPVYVPPVYVRPRYVAPYYYRRRVVCRIRYGAYGPRRVCVRR